MINIKNDLTIPIDNAINEFDQHLSICQRTIFSARFGDGKTYFLDKFKSHANDKYHFITIYPINYQVMENKDIFEFIKRDILIQMIANNMIEKKYEVDNLILAQYFLLNNSKELIFDLISIIPSIGLTGNIIQSFFAGIKTLPIINKYKDKIKEYKKDEHKSIDEFIKQIEDSKGSIYELDLISKIIIDNLRTFKKKTNKKVVFVVEDLDRIDPYHLFRILNLLTAHIDVPFQTPDRTNHIPTNKFGFDIIITVCDLEKVKSIFNHFYGEGANFEGYIDKFISHYCFHYSINSISQKYLYSFIEKECYLSERTLTNYKEFNEKMKILNMREVTKIIVNISDIINESNLSELKNENISSINYLTKFLAIIRLMGIESNTFIKYIKTKTQRPENIEIIKCLSFFLYASPEKKNTRKIENYYFKLIPKVSKNTITDILIFEEKISSEKAILLTQNALSECIINALKYIK